MKKYCKGLLGTVICLSMVSCSHIMNPNYRPGNKFNYGKGHYLNYRTIGKGKRTLILLHGFSASTHGWDDILPFLKGFDGKIIMFDLKGFGFSSKNADDYSMKSNAELISKFIESHKIKDYVIGGHSFGGGVALMTTLNQLDSKYKPDGLILIDSAAYNVELPFFISYLRTPILASLLLKCVSPELQAEYTLKKLYYNNSKIKEENIARYSFFMEMEGHNNTLLKCAKQIVPEDHEYYTSRYKNIDIPALVIWGENDTILPVRGAYKLKKDLSKSTLKIIKKCGHIPQEEYPEQTAGYINDFLKLAH